MSQTELVTLQSIVTVSIYDTVSFNQAVAIAVDRFANDCPLQD
jgi:hypothetical protein